MNEQTNNNHDKPSSFGRRPQSRPTSSGGYEAAARPSWSTLVFADLPPWKPREAGRGNSHLYAHGETEARVIKMTPLSSETLWG